MDIVDKDIEKAERDASPNKFPSPDQREALARTVTVSSSSSSGSSAPSVIRQEIGMSRLQTQRDDVVDLERHPTALSRIQTQRSQHSATVGASLKSRQSRKPLPEFGGGKPYPPPLPAREEYVVEFDGVDDPLHAQNWPLKRKLFIGVILGYTTLVSNFDTRPRLTHANWQKTAAFGSSIFSAATRKVAVIFGVSTEVGILGVSLYVLGFATGPILWAPFSELKGRRLPLVLGSFGFSIFSIAVAVGKDLQTILICRFWSGFFGACPLAVCLIQPPGL